VRLADFAPRLVVHWIEPHAGYVYFSGYQHTSPDGKEANGFVARVGAKGGKVEWLVTTRENTSVDWLALDGEFIYFAFPERMGSGDGLLCRMRIPVPVS